LLALKYLAPDDAATLADDLLGAHVYDFALGYRLHVMKPRATRARDPLYWAGWLVSCAKRAPRLPRDV